MANPSNYNNSLLTLAHCTVAPSLTEHSTLLPHFETGKPYAVSGKIRRGTYTLASINKDYTVIGIAEAEVLDSGFLSSGRCRTQAVVKLKEKREEPFTEKALENHHVLMPISHYKLRKAAKLMGLKILDY